MLLRKCVVQTKLIKTLSKSFVTQSIVRDKKNLLKPDWNVAVTEAEKLVGFSSSLWNLSCFKNDEMAKYITIRLEEFKSDDPIVTDTANFFLSNDKNSMGLIVLLYSLATKHSNLEANEEILNSQRALAEITQMIKISRLFHTALINVKPLSETKDEDLTARKNLLSWNKVALLSGDYLLANSFSELSKLKNQQLIELLALTGRDFSESQFIGDRDKQNMPLPSKPSTNLIDDILGNSEKDWTLRNTLMDGSLLGTGCKCCMNIAGKSEEKQMEAYSFGKHLALAWQSSLDLEVFLAPYEEGTTFNLVSAPILFHLSQDEPFYKEIEKGLETIEKVNFKKIHKEIVKGPGIQKTKELYLKHRTIVEDILNSLPNTDSKNALQNIISSMSQYNIN